MDKIVLKAEKRNLTGRKVKQIRKQGRLPANVYGKKVKSEAIEVSSSDFGVVFAKAGETGVVELTIGGRKKPVLVHNVQVDPVTDVPIHVDFLQVDLKVKVTAEVPVELTGEAPAEKQGLGTLVQYIDEVEVEALPTELPEKFEIDLSNLSEVDQAVYVKDIVLTKKAVIKNDPEQIVVKIEPLRKEEAPPAPEAGVAEGETGEVAAPEIEQKEEGVAAEPETPQEKGAS